MQESDAFLLPEEKEKDLEIERTIANTLAVVEKLRGERVELAKKNSFITALLTATEDSKIDPAARLSSAVKQALEFLGFTVEDIDAKTKSAIKKEDFWVIDGDFLGITEVTGTVNTNPKAQEFNAILGRLTTLYKRKTDLVLPEATSITRLLVLNFDIEHHPDRRPRAYTGELEHVVQSAEEQGIGVLSTVELHKIVVSVKAGNLSKDDARSLLKKPGRIEFDSSREKKLNECGQVTPSPPSCWGGWGIDRTPGRIGGAFLLFSGCGFWIFLFRYPSQSKPTLPVGSAEHPKIPRLLRRSFALFLANLPLYFQQLPRCPSRNPFLFKHLHCCRGWPYPCPPST